MDQKMVMAKVDRSSKQLIAMLRASTQQESLDTLVDDLFKDADKGPRRS
jgi:hypothetical protein